MMALNIKVTIFLVLFGLLSGLSVFVYGYMKTLKEERDIFLRQSIEFRNALEINEKTIDSLIADIGRSNEERERVYAQYRDAANRVNDLVEKLARHDLGVLAAARPGLIETRINRGTRDIFRCFEILSGSAITLEEIDATRQSQINASCSDIANPNYTTN
jgi:hypothetical protein